MKVLKTSILITIAAVTIIGIVLGLIAYSYTQIQLSLENVSYKGLEFASPSSSTIIKLAANFITGNWLGFALTLVTGVKLGLVFGLSNHGFFPVYIPNVSYDVLVNNVKVGQGQSHIDSTINPGQTKSFQDNTQDIQFGSIEPAITSIVNSGGIANFQVSGIAYFNFLGINVPVPFQSSRQINIVDEIKNHFSDYISQNQQNSNSQYSNNQYSNNSPQSSTQPNLEQQLQLAKNKIDAVITNNLPCTTPIPLLPLNGWVFDNYPRTTTISWLPVLGCGTYFVNIQYCDPDKLVCHPLTGGLTTNTFYTFDFPGAMIGRWQVESTDGKGQQSAPSNLQTFRYSR